MARETQLWNSLAAAKLVLRDALHMHRVENPASPGWPDVEGFLQEMGSFQYELKSEARPVRPDTRIHFKMRDKQIEYARRRWLVGGAIFWLLQVGDHAARRIYMIEGQHGALIDKGLTEAQLQELDLLEAVKFDPVKTIKLSFR